MNKNKISFQRLVGTHWRVLLITMSLIVSCTHKSMVPVSQVINEIQQVSSDALSLNNLYDHYPEKIKMDMVLNAQWMWDTTSTEDCTRDLMSLLVIRNEDTTNQKVLTNVSVLNSHFTIPKYCDSLNNFQEYIIPDMGVFDVPNQKMQILFCECKAGDFWKKPNNCYRPECLGEWKHGYSKGIGVYDNQGTEMKVYWVYVW